MSIEVRHANMDSVRYVIKEGSCVKLRWPSHPRKRILLDGVTANLLAQVYDAVNETNKATIDRMVTESPKTFQAIVARSFHIVNKIKNGG